MTLSANFNSLWSTVPDTLTATANADVNSSPYYIVIAEYSWDSTGGLQFFQVVAQCGAGTQCTATVTHWAASRYAFYAYISGASSQWSPPSTWPPDGFPGYVARSGRADVEWQVPGLWFRTVYDTTTTGTGTSVMLDAQTSVDLGPTPFYAIIFDATDGTYLGTCGYGTDCEFPVTQQAAITHKYIAYITSEYNDTTLPPAGMQSYSNIIWVTWNDSWQVSLVPDPVNYGVYTAYSNRDVAGTPYAIQVYDFRNDAAGNVTYSRPITTCWSGTTCSLVDPDSGLYMVAFIAQPGTAVEPPGIQASSQVQLEATYS